MAQGENRDDSEQSLELFFTAARETNPVPERRLLERVIADANRVQARVRRSRRSEADLKPVTGSRFVESLRETLGGWIIAGALAASACAGIVVGFAGPGFIADLHSKVFAADDSEFIEFLAVPSIEEFFPEDVS